MHQVTRNRIARHVDSLRHDPARLFADLIDLAMVEDALRQERVRWRDCVYTPCVTLWIFLGQVLCPDHSCRAAVARLIAALVARGEAPCSPDTGPYCKARQRRPVGLLSRLTRRIGQALEDRADADWTFKGRRVVLVDGTTVSMPDTCERRPESAARGGGRKVQRGAAAGKCSAGRGPNGGRNGRHPWSDSPPPAHDGGR